MLNPLKQFNYVVEINGLAAFIAQEVTTPEITVGEVEHTEGNVKKKTAGLISYGDITLSMLKVAPNADQWAYDWFELIKNGGAYLKNVVIRLRDENKKSINTVECKDCWVKKLGGITLSASADENVMEEVQMVVNDVVNT